MPPTPSWLWGTWSTIFGMNPETSVPVVSVRYLPTVPLEFASQFGKRDDFELSRSRDVPQALAASTTLRAATNFSEPSRVSMYVTPVALPEASTLTSRTIAYVTSVSRPVRRAGATRTLVEEKFELLRQPRLHWPQ